MARWNPEFSILAQSENGLFSRPEIVGEKVSWHEFDMGGLKKFFEATSYEVKEVKLSHLGPAFAQTDSFTAISDGAYVYRLSDEERKLYIWKNHEVFPLFEEPVAHIFPPVSSAQGSFLIKIRRDSTSENAPDELLYWNGGWSTILTDRDADSSSRFKSFRHQLALDEGQVAFVGEDDEGEGLFLWDQGEISVIVRRGGEIKSFDFFSPKLRNGVLVFRGVDQENRKAIWVHSKGKLSRLATQGDIVQTDKGMARIHYVNQDAIFYGAPGIASNGDIYQQATLTDADSPSTLLGIGLIKFNRE